MKNIYLLVLVMSLFSLFGCSNRVDESLIRPASNAQTNALLKKLEPGVSAGPVFVSTPGEIKHATFLNDYDVVLVGAKLNGMNGVAIFYSIAEENQPGALTKIIHTRHVKGPNPGSTRHKINTGNFTNASNLMRYLLNNDAAKP